MSGFVLIYRSVSQKFSNAAELGAWVDLLLLANWSDKTDQNGEQLKRGEIATSVRSLADRWGWSKSSVSRYLRKLERGTRIGTRTGTAGGTRIIILNYEQYQSVATLKNPPLGHQAGHEPGHEPGPIQRRSKKINNNPLPPLLDSDRFRAAWAEFEAARTEMRKPITDSNRRTIFKVLEQKGHERACRTVEWTNFKGWQGLREPSAADFEREILGHELAADVLAPSSALRVLPSAAERRLLRQAELKKQLEQKTLTIEVTR